MPWGTITPHFTWYEARDREGHPMPDDGQMWANIEEMARWLEVVREGRPLIVSSWWRSERHSAEQAKRMPGAHTTGKAVDVKCHGREARRIITVALAQNVSGLGIKQHGPRGSRFLHLDLCMTARNRPRPWVWTYA